MGISGYLLLRIGQVRITRPSFRPAAHDGGSVLWEHRVFSQTWFSLCPPVSKHREPRSLEQCVR